MNAARHNPKASRRFAFAGLALMMLATGCQQASQDLSMPSISIPTPSPTAGQAVQLDGLHNVVAYTPELICGAVPEGKAGLVTLAAMGIKSIVSVDGSAPDVETAERLGLRYVHLPIRYDGVTPEQQKALAQAITSLPHPIYMHCHHGKHRSAAALASAVVLTGELTPEQAMDRMAVSGTAKEYEGLWQAVRTARSVDGAQLAVDPTSFPKLSKVSGMVATMTEIDFANDNLKQLQKAGWTPPKDSPDLDRTKEAKRLHALFAQLADDPDSRRHPAEFQTMLAASIESSQQLALAVQADDRTTADRLLVTIGKSCKDCHRSYRDK